MCVSCRAARRAAAEKQFIDRLIQEKLTPGYWIPLSKYPKQRRMSQPMQQARARLYKILWTKQNLVIYGNYNW